MCDNGYVIADSITVKIVDRLMFKHEPLAMTCGSMKRKMADQLMLKNVTQIVACSCNKMEEGLFLLKQGRPGVWLDSITPR